MITSTPYSSAAVGIATVALTLATIQCSHDASPSGPSGGLIVSSVTLGATQVVAGSTSGGTVTLSAPAPVGGASVAVSSSNPAVATVLTPVMVRAGESNAALSVTGVAAGTATIAASLNGTTRRSSTLTVTQHPTLVVSSVTLSESLVVGGAAVRGTVVLSDVAPAGGAVVSLSAGDPAFVPPNVTVPAGLSAATFSVTTRPVNARVTVDVRADYRGASAVARLELTPPATATARFGVTGPSVTETCTLSPSGTVLNCTFNGSTSMAPGRIVAWDWSYGVATTFTQTTPGPVLSNPAVSCDMLPPPPLPPGPGWFAMTVTLVVHDDLGNVSPKAVNDGVRLIPTGACGF